jgi:hypothetical protein
VSFGEACNTVARRSGPREMDQMTVTGRLPQGLWPALTPDAARTARNRSGAGQKEDQQFKIHLTEVSTV